MNASDKNQALGRMAVVLMLSSLSILAGGLIYTLFRPVESIFFNWIRLAELGHILTKLQDLHPTFIINTPAWIIYSLPNGLWAFSYAALIVHIWWNNQTILKTIWIATIPCLVFGYEFLQLTKIISGTFCFQDLFLGAVGIASGIVVGIITSKK